MLETLLTSWFLIAGWILMGLVLGAAAGGAAPKPERSVL
jgi:hypothetical protein